MPHVPGSIKGVLAGPRGSQVLLPRSPAVAQFFFFYALHCITASHDPGDSLDTTLG